MPSDAVFDLVTTGATVTKLVSDKPNEEIAKVSRSLFSAKSIAHKNRKRAKNVDEYTSEDLDRAAKCGVFPYRPSELFLKMYCDVLDTLEQDPLINMVSPSLIGSSGVIPLSIVSVIPDIMRHYRNLIANAETEVMIATNYWERSYSSSLVHDALIQLSQKHTGALNKPVVKLIYDRGSPKQVIKNHRRVSDDRWESLGLPKKEEIPNIEFEVMNFHRPVMGTFHSKYLIVDRKVACLNSNNVQDRVNVEMMTHIEGPIVDAFYDMGLLSWSEALHPPFPLLKGGGGAPRDGEEYKFAEENRYVKDIALAEAAKTNCESWKPNGKENWTRFSEEAHENRQSKPKEAVSDGHRADTAEDNKADRPKADHPDPIAKQYVPSSEMAGAEEIRHADKERAAAERRYGAPQSLASHLNAGMQDTQPSAGPEVAQGFKPHILHKSHKPFPIVMVNRPPSGKPGHADVNVPQNAAWLAGFRLAQKNIFIQTPTFNAAPAVKAILDACRRGVQCTIYLDLGFNDGGEQMPMQGGTNSKVVASMFKTLGAEKKQQFLHVFWYTAKDQEKPIDAAEKRRNCHVKFCTIDDQVAIQGNGNQDTQSWFHSQESNIMVDSAEMCAEWRAGIDNNQNTALFGKIDDKDGFWKDKYGNILDSSIGKGGPMAIVKGVMGTIARVQGKGGF